MNINKNIISNGNFDTKMFNTLNSIDDEILHHGEHNNLRHPKAIYNISSRRVYDAFYDFIVKYDNKDNMKDIEKAHFEILCALIAYVDDIYLIIKCFYPSSSVTKDTEYVTNWLKKADKQTFELYTSSFFKYTDKFNKIVNKVKHNHARYCQVAFKTNYKTIYGYYIEGVSNGESIQPDLDIHPKYNDMYTAISYNYDIKMLLTCFYIVSEIASQTIDNIVLKLTGKKINYIVVEDSRNEEIKSIISSIIRLDALFFPDEYGKDIPQIELNEKELFIREVAYKSFINKLPPITHRQIRVIFTADGVTTKWVLPYK